jgi:hypothetical protein
MTRRQQNPALGALTPMILPDLSSLRTILIPMSGTARRL